MAAPTVKLHTGQQLPVVGLGTWKSKPGEVGAAIKAAVKAGYRHIDCAQNYLNENEIGDTLTELFKDGVVKREELFITSKLNNPYHHKEHVRMACEKTLKDLNLKYLDLYLMHWPVAFHHVPFDPSRRGFHEKYDPDGCTELDLSKWGGSKVDDSVSIQETWQAMEELVDAGLVRAIGVCNFTAILMHDLLTYARIRPAVVQNEMHPFLQQAPFIEFCNKRNIVVQAYSPLGSNDFRKENEPSVLQNPELQKIGKKYGKSSAQVALRWAVQRGTVPLPKSIHEDRLQQNIDIFDFELSKDEMQVIEGLDRDYHYLRPFDWYKIPIFGHC